MLNYTDEKSIEDLFISIFPIMESNIGFFFFFWSRLLSLSISFRKILFPSKYFTMKRIMTYFFLLKNDAKWIALMALGGQGIALLSLAYQAPVRLGFWKSLLSPLWPSFSWIECLCTSGTSLGSQNITDIFVFYMVLFLSKVDHQASISLTPLQVAYLCGVFCIFKNSYILSSGVLF